MTTIVVDVGRTETALYADRYVCVGHGRFAYLSNKIRDYGQYKVALAGNYSYLPPSVDESFLTDNPESLFRLLANWYINHLKDFKEDRTGSESPLTVIALNTDTGRVYSNILGAHAPMELELGIYAFGGGEEYAQGYLNAVRYFGDVEYHHVQEMYSSISRLGYGTSHDFNYVRANRRS